MSIKTGKGGCVHAVPYDVDNPTGPERTDGGMRTHAIKADSTGSPVSEWTYALLNNYIAFIKCIHVCMLACTRLTCIDCLCSSYYIGIWCKGTLLAGHYSIIWYSTRNVIWLYALCPLSGVQVTSSAVVQLNIPQGAVVCWQQGEGNR